MRKIIKYYILWKTIHLNDLDFIDIFTWGCPLKFFKKNGLKYYKRWQLYTLWWMQGLFYKITLEISAWNIWLLSACKAIIKHLALPKALAASRETSKLCECSQPFDESARNFELELFKDVRYVNLGSNKTRISFHIFTYISTLMCTRRNPCYTLLMSPYIDTDLLRTGNDGI